jgi:hypothetical protein
MLLGKVNFYCLKFTPFLGNTWFSGISFGYEEIGDETGMNPAKHIMLLMVTC